MAPHVAERDSVNAVCTAMAACSQTYSLLTPPPTALCAALLCPAVVDWQPPAQAALPSDTMLFCQRMLLIHAVAV